MTDLHPLADSLVSEILNYANVILTAGIIVMMVRRWRLKSTSSQYIRLGKFEIGSLIFLGIYWAVVYAYITFDQPGSQIVCAWLGDCSNNWFGSVFIKPALTFTFAMMFSISMRTEQIEDQCSILRETVP